MVCLSVINNSEKISPEIVEFESMPSPFQLRIQQEVEPLISIAVEHSCHSYAASVAKDLQAYGGHELGIDVNEMSLGCHLIFDPGGAGL